MPKTVTRQDTRRTKPLQWRDIDYWFDWLDQDGFTAHWRKARVDERLVTIAPSFQGIIQSLRGHSSDISPDRRALILSLAQRAGGSAGIQSPARDSRRVLAVCDWMVRCALPIWLDRLPRWCADGTQNRLRAGQPLQWAVQVVEALSELAPLWNDLATAARDRGTHAERAAILAAHGKADLAMAVLADALQHTLHDVSGLRHRHVNRNDESRLCRRALGVIRVDDVFGGRDEDPTVAATLPRLLDVLYTVQPGDSQRSVADRCVWTKSQKARVKRAA